MWKRLMAGCFVFGLAASAPPALAQAQSTCGSHDKISQTLETQYGESVVARGLQSATRLFEVWRSDQTGTWTMLVVLPTGTACVMASGSAWLEEKPVPPGIGS